MTTEHTPGPWFIAEGGVCAANCPADGSNVICLEPEAAMAASLAKWDDNASLIAAAPELVGALEEAAGWFEQYAKDHYAKALTAPDGGEQHSREVKGKINRDRANQLRAAVAKALGK